MPSLPFRRAIEERSPLPSAGQTAPTKRAPKGSTTRLRRLLVRLTALVGFAGCDRPIANEILIDPTFESAATISSDTVPRGLSSPVAARWRAAKAAILGAETVLRLGHDMGGHETFGAIRDVAMASNGQVFVLDDHAQAVRVFDSAGRFLETIGGVGDGPMEFRSASGIELLEDRTLVVSTFAGHVKSFAKVDAAWELSEFIRLPEIGTRDLCTTASKRIILTGHKRDDNTLVHELSIPGGELRSMTPGYQHDNSVVQMTMGDGVIECLNSPDRIVFAGSHHGIVRSFDLATGEEVWVSRIAGFVPRPIHEYRDGSITRPRTSEWEMVGAVNEVLAGILVIQVGRFVPATETVTVRSYLVDANSGSGAFLGDKLPPIVAVPAGYVALFEDPYPRLEVRRFTRTNGATL